MFYLASAREEVNELPNKDVSEVKVRPGSARKRMRRLVRNSASGVRHLPLRLRHPRGRQRYEAGRPRLETVAHR